MQEIIDGGKFTIVYLAFGSESIKYQTILSIYTLCHHIGSDNKDFSLVIYTDGMHSLFDKYLYGLPVKFEILTKKIIKQFKGIDNCDFRIKLCVIQLYFEKYKSAIFFTDADTYFNSNPLSLLNRISHGYSIMNVEEYDFINGIAAEPIRWYTLRQALKRHTYKINGTDVRIPINTMMWNAGVIGLSYEDSRLIQMVIDLTDEMYSKCKVFFVEQFATSYILQANTHLFSTESHIEHYWSREIKKTFNLRIPVFLRQNNGKPKAELYEMAFAFAQETGKIATPHREPVLTRIILRLKLIIQVALKGYL